MAKIETGSSGLDAERLGKFSTYGIDTYYVMSGKRHAQTIDWALVGRILTDLHARCALGNLTLSPEKKGLVLKMVYSQSCATGMVDQPYLADLNDFAS